MSNFLLVCLVPSKMLIFYGVGEGFLVFWFFLPLEAKIQSEE
jgi:hypothetical protein